MEFKRVYNLNYPKNKAYIKTNPLINKSNES